MATVYLARRVGARGFSKVFALKRVKQKHAADADFARMFLREARLSAMLRHPNIAQVVDFGQDGREYYLVMEYVHGTDLRQLLRASEKARLPLPCSLAIVTRLCAALHYAHRRTAADGKLLGLVHRDVTPTNVLLSTDGAVKLADFGIAKAFGDPATATSSGLMVGKPGYMSPEQIRTEPLDGRSDVFSLGVLLYEVTTGHRCFFGDNVFAVLNATQAAAPVLPSVRVPGYPKALEELVLRALKPDVNDRFPTAQALQLALEDLALDHKMRISDTVVCDYLEQVGISPGGLDDDWSPVEPSHPSESARTQSPTIAGAPAPNKGRVHKSGRSWLLVAIGVALGAGALAGVLPRWGTAPPTSTQTDGAPAESTPEQAKTEPEAAAGPAAEAQAAKPPPTTPVLSDEKEQPLSEALGDPLDPPGPSASEARPSGRRTKRPSKKKLSTGRNGRRAPRQPGHAAGEKADEFDVVVPPSRQKQR